MEPGVSDLETRKGWVVCRVGELSELIRGVSYTKTAASGTRKAGYLPILRANNINGIINFEDLVFLPNKLIDNSQYLQRGDILFAMSSGSKNLVGKSARISDDLECGFGAFCGLLRPVKNISNKYLHQVFQYRDFRSKISEIAKGSNINNLKREHILEYEFPLPPLNEQKRIVGKIEELFSELDAGVENLKKAKEQLGIYRQSLLKQAFEGKLTEQWRKDHADELESAETLLANIRAEREARYQQQLQDWQTAVSIWESNGGEGKKPTKPSKPNPNDPFSKDDLDIFQKLPNSWGYIRLGETIIGIEAGKSFSCDERTPNEGEIGVAKVSAVTWGEYDERESKTCVDHAKINPQYFIKKGDFILSRANTIELVGACVIVKNTTKCVMLSDKTLRINFAFVEPNYVLWYLRSRLGRREIMKRSTGNQESMRNIGQDRISAIVLPISSVPEQREIVRIIDQKFAAIEENEKEIEAALQRAEALRQSILKKAFSGELVPQDPNDEPASVLLERIRKEREAAALTKKPSPRRKKSASSK